MDLSTSHIEAANALLVTVRGALVASAIGFDWRDSSPIRAARSVAATGKSVRLVGAGGSVILSPEGLDRWLGEYFIAIPLSLAGDPASDDDAQRGIGWVLHVGAPGRELQGVEDLDVNDVLKGVISEEFSKAKRG